MNPKAFLKNINSTVKTSSNSIYTNLITNAACYTLKFVKDNDFFSITDTRMMLISLIRMFSLFWKII